MCPDYIDLFVAQLFINGLMHSWYFTITAYRVYWYYVILSGGGDVVYNAFSVS